MNNQTRTILHNAHPASLIIVAGSVMGGLTASVIRGGITLFPAIMTMLFALLLQTTANLYHGFFDLNYGAGENIGGMHDRNSRSYNSSRVLLLRMVANGFGILTLTAGISIFSFIGWVAAGYGIVIAVLLYLYFTGPKPAVRTKWSVLFTFLFFGPIGVSGTALIQNMHSHEWLPVAVYSVIIGLLAVNAHIAIQYLRYEEDKVNGKETLVTAEGGHFTRFIYLGNAIIVTAILIIRPTAIEYVSPWVGISIGVCLVISSIWVAMKMHRDPTTGSRMVRSVTMWQYIIVTLTLMIIVIYSVRDFEINIIELI